MFRSPMRFGTLSIMLLAVILAACSTAVGSDPSPTPHSPEASDSGDPTPSAPAEPSREPSEEPSPEAPDPTPVPTAKPIEVVRFDGRVIARVTADDVAVRVLPGLDQPLADGYHLEGEAIPEVRLSEGNTIGVYWGPVVVDGMSWYSVIHGDTDNVTWSEGWVAGEYLVEIEPMDIHPLVAAADGQGAGAAVTGTVSAHAPLYVNAVVTPMPGEDGCEAELVVIGTDGETTVVGSETVTETLGMFGSPLENADLMQDSAGEVVLQMRTDCSWAAMAFIPQG
jgi:hypothetical protein